MHLLTSLHFSALRQLVNIIEQKNNVSERDAVNAQVFYHEIGRMLHISTSAVKTYFHRANPAQTVTLT
jgi:predicted transcriptional regulator